MRVASALTSRIRPRWLATISPSGAASTSSRNGRSPSDMGEPRAEQGAGGGVLDLDRPAMGLDGDLAERQPEAAVLVADAVAGLEPLEDVGAPIGHHAGAAIAGAQIGGAGGRPPEPAG